MEQVYIWDKKRTIGIPKAIFQVFYTSVFAAA